MALMKCPECEREISNTSKICIHVVILYTRKGIYPKSLL